VEEIKENVMLLLEMLSAFDPTKALLLDRI
jgi:hypothetical protein